MQKLIDQYHTTFDSNNTGTNSFFSKNKLRKKSLEWKMIMKYFENNQFKAKHIASVGCNNGKLDRDLIKFFPELHTYTCIDSNKDAIETFKYNSQLDFILSTKKYIFINQKYETFCEEIDKKYDMILMIIISSKLDSLIDSIKKSKTLLNTNGKLIIIEETDTGINHIKSSLLNINKFTSNQIITLLEQHNINYNYDEIKHVIDMEYTPDSAVAELIYDYSPSSDDYNLYIDNKEKYVINNTITHTCAVFEITN